MTNIGIDLGTWNSAAAFSPEASPPIDVKGRDGETIYGKTFPSFVFFDANGEVVRVGEVLKERALNPGLVVWGVKRFVGMPYDEAYRTEDGFKLFGYRDRIERTENGGIGIRFGSKVFTPTDVLAILLRRIKEDAENKAQNPMLHGKVDGAVITVPAYFDPTRTDPILRAAELAGFGRVEKEVTQMSEPTAAMLSYVTANRDCLPHGGKGLHVLTFDIGAGTTDLTLNRYNMIDGDTVASEVSVEGDNHVGGINMDNALLEFLKGKYANSGLADDVLAQAKLLPKIEEAKIELTEYPESDKVSLLTAVAGRPARFELERAELADAIAPVLEKAVRPLHELFRVAKSRSSVGSDRVDVVLFVGGPSKMPWLRQRVRRELAEIGVREEVLMQIDRIDTDGFPSGCDPMKAVAHGAALSASGKVSFQGLNPYGYGVTLANDYYECILKENQPYPTREERIELFYRSMRNLVCVRLVRKEKNQYVRLQEFDFYLPGERGVPCVEAKLGVTENKRLTVRIRSSRSAHSVEYREADLFTGEVMELQEDNPPSGDSTPPPEVERPQWSRGQLLKVIGAARAVLDLAKTSSHPDKVAVLRDAIALASQPAADPNATCPEVLNRATVLLYALRTTDALTDEEFQSSRTQLRSIEQGD